MNTVDYSSSDTVKEKVATVSLDTGALQYYATANRGFKLQSGYWNYCDVGGTWRVFQKVGDGVVSIGTINDKSSGSGIDAARSNHAHAHGNFTSWDIGAGTYAHALATTSAHGFMSSTDCHNVLDGMLINIGGLGDWNFISPYFYGAITVDVNSAVGLWVSVNVFTPCGLIRNVWGMPLAHQALDLVYFNQGGMSVAAYGGSYFYWGVNDGATTTLRGVYVSYPTPYMFVEGSFDLIPAVSVAASTYSYICIFFREAATAKAVTIGMYLDHATQLARIIYWPWTNNTTRGTGVSAIMATGVAAYFFRIRLIGSTVYAQYSTDRMNWVNIASIAKTTAFTTGPDQVGIAGYGANVACRAVLNHLLIGDL